MPTDDLVNYLGGIANKSSVHAAFSGPSLAEGKMASFVVKAAPRPEGADRVEFDEKTMWRDKDARPGNEAFIADAI